MTNLSKIFSQQAGVFSGNFSPSSRYIHTEIITVENESGEKIACIKRRIIPSVDHYFVLQKHILTEDERPDLLAHKYLNDAEKFWQIADANNVIHPAELTGEPGKKINITLPVGIPGNSNA